MNEYTTAIHEAGYAVVAAALGMKFHKHAITIASKRSKGKKVAGSVLLKLADYRGGHVVASLLAGGIAESRVRYGKRSVRYNSSADGDMGAVSAVIQENVAKGYVVADLQTNLKLLRAEADLARDILTQHWSAVLALADHLVKVKRMSGPKLSAFLKAHDVS